MTKAEAVQLFGGVVKLAEACGVKHPAVCQWPDELSPTIADKVIEVALLHDKPVSRLALETALMRHEAKFDLAQQIKARLEQADFPQ